MCNAFCLGGSEKRALFLYHNNCSNRCLTRKELERTERSLIAQGKGFGVVNFGMEAAVQEFNVGKKWDLSH